MCGRWWAWTSTGSHAVPSRFILLHPPILFSPSLFPTLPQKIDTCPPNSSLSPLSSSIPQKYPSSLSLSPPLLPPITLQSPPQPQPPPLSSLPPPFQADNANVVDETLKKIKAHKGIKGIIILTGEGIPIRSDLTPEETINYAGLVTNFVRKARELVKRLPVPPRKDAAADVALDEQPVDQELEVLRVRSHKHEIIIAPEFKKGTDYILVVIQDPSVE